MSTRKQDKAISFQQIWQLVKIHRQTAAVASWSACHRQTTKNLAMSGFVLPTVAMVSLVVVLNTAMMLR